MPFAKNFLYRVFCIAFIGFSLSSVAKEDIPQQNNQVAGYYRMMLGDYEVTALYDGYTTIDNKLFKNIAAKDFEKLLQKAFVDNKDKGVKTAINAFLINTNDQLILFDTGASNCLGKTSGKLLENLKAAGYSPDQVTAILLTHLHPDHACGLVKDGKRVFQNAMLYVNQAEAGYWLNHKFEEAASEDKRDIFKLAQSALAPYQAVNKFKTFTDQLPITTIKLMPSTGHTPGHMSYLISSKGLSLLVMGDIIHNHTIQFKYPDVAIDYDSNAKQAIASRKKILAYAARNKLWLAGAHLPFPGLGRVIKEESGYKWFPIEYSLIESSQ